MSSLKKFTSVLETIPLEVPSIPTTAEEYRDMTIWLGECVSERQVMNDMLIDFSFLPYKPLYVIWVESHITPEEDKEAYVELQYKRLHAVTQEGLARFISFLGGVGQEQEPDDLLSIIRRRFPDDVLYKCQTFEELPAKDQTELVGTIEKTILEMKAAREAAGAQVRLDYLVEQISRD